MFGTKKIYAKIINGKLVIRVGGGYMSIDEFMFYYGAQELNKMIAYEAVDDNEELDLESALDGESNKGDLIKHSKEGQSIIGVQQMKKRLSPRLLSPRAGSPHPSQANQKRSAQGVASPKNVARMGSPRNIAGSRNDAGRGTDSVRSGISGRRSPDGGASFLRKTTQKKIGESEEQQQMRRESSKKIEMQIREKQNSRQQQ